MTDLSPREHEIASLVADDLPDKEIARILRLSVRTVHEYLDRISKKIGGGPRIGTRRRIIARWVAVRRIADARS